MWGQGSGNNLKLLVTQLLKWRASCTVFSFSFSPHSKRKKDHTTAMKIMVHQQHSPRAIFLEKESPCEDNKLKKIKIKKHGRL